MTPLCFMFFSSLYVPTCLWLDGLKKQLLLKSSEADLLKYYLLSEK